MWGNNQQIEKITPWKNTVTKTDASEKIPMILKFLKFFGKLDFRTDQETLLILKILKNS